MILQYFKSKENEYKNEADNIYIRIVSQSKQMMTKDYFRLINFDTSFELITIILIFYLNVFKQNNDQKFKQINDLLMKNLIQDIDKTMRELGIGDMSIGKYVKKYVKKFYYRLKNIDRIFNKNMKTELPTYLSSLKNINSQNIPNFTNDLIRIYEEIKNYEESH